MRIRLAAAALVALAGTGCAAPPAPGTGTSAGVEAEAAHPSRLPATAAAWAAPAPQSPGAPPLADWAPGVQPLATSTPEQEVLAHVPPGLSAETPATLVLALHGAGGDARGGLAPLTPYADDARLLLVAPSSVGPTWDAIGGEWGPDVGLVDASLREALERWPVRRDRLVVSGFSDGASYALGLGLANGDLATHVVAFAPGFVPSAPTAGTPAVFVTHGVADDVLPIERTSRRIVPRLEERGHAVEYREFEGGHVVPPDLAAEAVRWLEPGTSG